MAGRSGRAGGTSIGWWARLLHFYTYFSVDSIGKAGRVVDERRACGVSDATRSLSSVWGIALLSALASRAVSGLTAEWSVVLIVLSVTLVALATKQSKVA